MSKTIKYIGTQTRWSELSITGKQSTWSPDATDERSDTEAALLLATGQFSDVDATLLPEPKVVALSGVVSGDRIADAASRDITAADNAKSLAPTGALTYTIPAGLSPMPSFTVDCPASGTISIAKSGAATLNGAGTTLTRTRASNPVGFVVLAHTDTDAYGVSGS
jgi:hypothetical protein